VQILVLSIVVALVVLLLLLGAFGLFTFTPLAHRIEERELRHHHGG
jgi:hypothetical protein